jgi:hypothetical protein
MLDTRFPRPPGDIGNPLSFHALGVEVLYRAVAGASARRVVETRDPLLLEPFIAAGRELVAAGAERIGTSCGFLACFQEALVKALPVPVVSSSLLACASADSPGILTFSAESLDDQVLRGAGVPPGTPVQGIPASGELHTRILNDEAELDRQAAEREVVQAAKALVERYPSVGTIVLECTNLGPYRREIEAATGRITVDAVQMLCAGLNQPRA